MSALSFTVSDADVAFFRTFGFLHLRSIQRGDAPAIAQAFEEVFGTHTQVGRSGRSSVARIAERSQVLEKLLLAEHRCPSVARALLGTPVSYVGGDGVRYSGATYWHRDGDHRALRLLKIVQYLEPLGRESGALRIIPGTNRVGTGWDGYAAELTDPERYLGLDATDVPCFVIESTQDDLIAFDPHSYHASFGGADGRRQITVTFAGLPADAVAKQELAKYLLADRSVL